MIVDKSVTVTRRRPHALSTAHPYVSWKGLTDQTWSARHLGPASLKVQPPSSDLRKFFQARQSGQVYCCKSTVLFPTFAQYLTDGFIRSVMPNESKNEDRNLRKRNTSNHQIDMCPLYGRNEVQTNALRLLSEEGGRKGRLRSQIINGEEYAPFLYDGKGTRRAEFANLDAPVNEDKIDLIGKRSTIFAFGGDRANTSPQVAMMNTLFLREHNRLAGLIEQAHPDWDDEHVFQVARNCVIVIFIKIVVEDYIKHIAPTPISILADPAVAWKAPWNKPNWITVEFSLLYRWHSLLPKQVTWNGIPYEVERSTLNNQPLIDTGLGKAFAELSLQKATRLGALNTASPMLVDFEERAIDHGRVCGLDTYAKYREYVGLPVPQTFEDISRDLEVVNLLKAFYPTPADIEFYIGIFAEDAEENGPLPPLIRRMVAVDAFSQALTNPLLSEHVYVKSTFSEPGWAAIHDTQSLCQIVTRNIPAGSSPGYIGMTQKDWTYRWPESEAKATLAEVAALATTGEGRRRLGGFGISTVAEVAGLIMWLKLYSTGNIWQGFGWLVAGEAVEWALLALMITSSRLSAPKRNNAVRSSLIVTGLISVSEALLWVIWIGMANHVGILPATLLLAVAMHVKHDAEMSVFLGRPLLQNVFDSREITASAFEAFGAGLWLWLTMAGHVVTGAIVLFACITIEHVLQFKTAGFLDVGETGTRSEVQRQA